MWYQWDLPGCEWPMSQWLSLLGMSTLIVCHDGDVWAVTDSSWLFLDLYTKNVCNTNELTTVYISQDSICPILCAVLWMLKCLFIFSSHFSLLNLHSKLWKCCSSRAGQVPDIIDNQSVIEGHWWPYWKWFPLNGSSGNRIVGNWKWMRMEDLNGRKGKNSWWGWRMPVVGDRGDMGHNDSWLWSERS